MMKSEDTASFSLVWQREAENIILTCHHHTVFRDFLKSPYGLPLIANSSIQLLLKQLLTSIDTVQKTFNLSDEENIYCLNHAWGGNIFRGS